MYIFKYLRLRFLFIINSRSFSTYSCLFFRSLRGVMAKVLVWGLEVSDFDLQSRYYVHFRTNTPGKIVSPLSQPQLRVK